MKSQDYSLALTRCSMQSEGFGMHLARTLSFKRMFLYVEQMALTLTIKNIYCISGT